MTITSPNEALIDWNPEQWAVRMASAPRSTLEQSPAYGDAVRAHYGLRVDRAMVRWNGAPVAAFQCLRQRVRFLGEAVRIVRGPVWLGPEPDPDTRCAIWAAIRDQFSLRRRELFFWMPEMTAGPDGNSLMRSIGKRRMITGLGTIWLDVTLGEEILRAQLAGKWRNMLRKAEKSNLSVNVSRSRRQVDETLAAYDSFRREHRFNGPPGAFVGAIAKAAGPEDILHVTATRGGDRIAGMILIRHGNCATYYVSWNSAAARQLCAHHLMLWRAIIDLGQAGVTLLDLGGINTDSAPGVARFKLGLGGAPEILSGTWL